MVTYVMSDIHGEYHMSVELLEKIQLKEDRLQSSGWGHADV